jgi:hypothetical protein
MKIRFLFAALLLALTATASAQTVQPLSWMKNSMTTLESQLVSKYGEAQRPRIVKGLQQVSQFWRAEDGDAAAFDAFVTTHFAGDQKTLDEIFNRMQFLLESLDGHMNEIGRDLKWQTEIDRGEIYPLDEITAGYDPSAHLNDDLFANKVAFIVLLNFPLTTLDERLTKGETWTRRQWAETKLAQRFSKRIPAEVNLAVAEATAKADQYIASYNIWMHHLVDDKGNRLFPAKKRLLSHWNLRDEIKADYSDGKEALPKQRTIARLMERIVDQSIPEVVVDNPNVDWNPFTNTVTAAKVSDADPGVGRPAPATITNAPEPNTRYAVLLDTFKAAKKIDPYSPTAPTHIDRRFNEDRQIPEARVREMFEQIMTSPLVPKVAKLIEKRLGRKLEPFDIWYNGFRPRGAYTEAQLDDITKKLYPTPEAYHKGMASMLEKLGFSKERAQYLSENIEVDPARGSGHAMAAYRRGDNPHLRTRVGKDGMDYKGYNIAVHENGHNVEQVFSLKHIDYYTLASVPNTAFTEALAFVFQNKDLELLGLSKPSDESRALQSLNDFWGTYEIAGVALVDMEVWRWMYANPDATPAQLRDATVRISKEMWNKYYAPVFGKKDVLLLGIYSHMIHSYLYLPDYPIGHLIAHQVEEQMEKSGSIGPDFERITKTGSVTPDLWMKTATGAPVGTEAMIHSTEKALTIIKK